MREGLFCRRAQFNRIAGRDELLLIKNPCGRVGLYTVRTSGSSSLPGKAGTPPYRVTGTGSQRRQRLKLARNGPGESRRQAVPCRCQSSIAEASVRDSTLQFCFLGCRSGNWCFTLGKCRGFRFRACRNYPFSFCSCDRWLVRRKGAGDFCVGVSVFRLPLLLYGASLYPRRCTRRYPVPYHFRSIRRTGYLVQHGSKACRARLTPRPRQS